MRLIFYVIIFFLILNSRWMLDKLQGKQTNKNALDLFFLPVMFGVLLTIVDLIGMFVGIIIFIIVSLLGYYVYKKLRSN